ncbi:hypothetical protein FB548_0760 [Pseudoxanthomonas sp. 3HH-4]|nr:hypothetical protein FB548_0760 [Pseudoxanthomonas sp. 3HH-4]
MRIVCRSRPTVESAQEQALPERAAENAGLHCALLYSDRTIPVLEY